MTAPTPVGKRDSLFDGIEAHPRSILAITLGLTLAALVELALQARRTGVLLISWKWQAALGLGALLALAEAVLLASAGRASVVRLARRLHSRWQALLRQKLVCAVLLALILPTFPIAAFGPTGRFLEGLFPRLLAFWLVVLVAASLLQAWWTGASWTKLLLATAVAYGVLVRLLTFVPDVSAYPFSLGWSEASRYYYASLFFAPRIYGDFVGLPELHPTRYFLQSIPYLIPALPLWFHRLWQVVLWWALPLTAAALLIRRMELSGRWVRILVGGWIVLFLFQGPVYYHLLVTVALILAGVDSRRPWRSTLLVLVASAWAGVSRLNWFPVPGLLAACLFILDRPQEAKPSPASLGWPAAWVLAGTLIAFVSDAVYVRLSGLPAERFTSSLSSDLLIYRLFPNATYALGVLPAILIASAPLAAALWHARTAWRAKLHPAAQVFVAGALAVLLAGGLVVSLKIGGGSNLHNLDAYLVLLVVVAGVLLLRPMESRPSAVPRLSFGLAASIVAVPVAFALGIGGPWPRLDRSAASESLHVVQEQVAEAAEAGTRILFISQRHLLTFGMVPAVPLEADYETVFLMEMAMSGNRSYLDRFHAQLRDHDFGLIVVDRLATTYQGRGHSFGEENDAWVREVSLPILCAYEPVVNLEEPRIELLVPRSGPAACPE